MCVVCAVCGVCGMCGVCGVCGLLAWLLAFPCVATPRLVNLDLHTGKVEMQNSCLVEAKSVFFLLMYPMESGCLFQKPGDKNF